MTAVIHTHQKSCELSPPSSPGSIRGSARATHVTLPNPEILLLQAEARFSRYIYTMETKSPARWLALGILFCWISCSSQLMAQTAPGEPVTDAVCKGKFRCKGDPAEPLRDTDVGRVPMVDGESCFHLRATAWVVGFAAGVCKDKGGVEGGVSTGCTMERPGRPTNWDREF